MATDREPHLQARWPVATELHLRGGWLLVPGYHVVAPLFDTRRTVWVCLLLCDVLLLSRHAQFFRRGPEVRRAGGAAHCSPVAGPPPLSAPAWWGAHASSRSGRGVACCQMYPDVGSLRRSFPQRHSLHPFIFQICAVFRLQCFGFLLPLAPSPFRRCLRCRCPHPALLDLYKTLSSSFRIVQYTSTTGCQRAATGLARRR